MSGAGENTTWKSFEGPEGTLYSNRTERTLKLGGLVAVVNNR